MDALVFFVLLSFAELVLIVYLANKLTSLISKKQSMASTHGKIFEEIVPFSKEFPFDPKSFRFIGDPVDGIAFNDNEVVFCEIKLNNSALSGRQKHIKSLVEQKKVRWQVIRGR